MVGVAVNVTVWPEQTTLPGLATILTDAVALVTIEMVILFDVAVGCDTQVEFEVITTVITSPLTNELEEYVEEVAPPIVLPFFCH